MCMIKYRWGLGVIMNSKKFMGILIFYFMISTDFAGTCPTSLGAKLLSEDKASINAFHNFNFNQLDVKSKVGL